MKKLIQGIVDFRRHVQPGYREKFAHLALGQRPDALFIACSDSRVVPNVFASSNPGDLFVIRNVGNIIPPCGPDGRSESDESEAAALEFAVLTLGVRDIIICGHSECGAMRALLDGRAAVASPNLRAWLRHSEPALAGVRSGQAVNPGLPPHNCLSQINVLHQLEHLRSYPFLQERARAGQLGLHGWWFDIQHAEVYAYEETQRRFVLIDDEEGERLLQRLTR